MRIGNSPTRRSLGWASAGSNLACVPYWRFVSHTRVNSAGSFIIRWRCRIICLTASPMRASPSDWPIAVLGPRTGYGRRNPTGRSGATSAETRRRSSPGLRRFVDLSKDFRGKEAMQAVGIRSKCVTVLIDGPPDADPWGREALCDGCRHTDRAADFGRLVRRSSASKSESVTWLPCLPNLEPVCRCE